jgi:hypothetical protein
MFVGIFALSLISETYSGGTRYVVRVRHRQTYTRQETGMRTFAKTALHAQCLTFRRILYHDGGESPGIVPTSVPVQLITPQSIDQMPEEVSWLTRTITVIDVNWSDAALILILGRLLHAINTSSEATCSKRNWLLTGGECSCFPRLPLKNLLAAITASTI